MSTIKLKHSTTASAVPTTGDLVAGELALNIADGTIHFENAAGNAVFSFDISEDYVTLGTTQTITGAKTFTSTLTMAGTIDSTVAQDNNILQWDATGRLRRMTDQGGINLSCDSSILLHAGDNHTNLETELGITNATTGENIYVTADSDVVVITGRQDGVYPSVTDEWTFSNGGTLTCPGQVIADTIVLNPDTTTDTWGLRLESSNATSNDSGFWSRSSVWSILLRDASGNIDIDLNPEANSFFNGNVDFNSAVTVDGALDVANQIRHIGDTNTYMQFVAEDNWRVVTGGAERLRVANHGVEIDADSGLIHNMGSNSHHIISPGGGNYRNWVSTITGAIEISFPAGVYADAEMFTWWVDIYDYTANESVSYFCAGYLYQVEGQNEWVNTTVVPVAANSNRYFTFRFGAEGSRHKVWIGELATTWAYLNVQIRNVCVHGSGVSPAADWADDFLISIESTAFGTVDETVSPASYATNADSLDGFDTSTTGNRWGVIPVVGSDGVMEVGQYIDFHGADGSTDDYDWRINCGGASNNNLTFTDDGGSVRLTLEDGGTVSADNFEVTGLGPNTTPGTDDLRIGGYGILGDRAAPVYISNATQGIRLNYGGVHNQNTKLETLSTGISVTGDITVDGNVDGVDVSAIPSTYLPIGGSSSADVDVREIHFTNQEPSNLTADGQLGYDASIGLMVYKTQNYGDAGDVDGVYMVLDTGNIATDANLELSGNGVTGGGTTPLTISMSDAGIGAGTYGSTADGTKIDQITVDSKGRITAITTGGTGSSSTTGTVTSVSGGNGLTGTVTTSGSLAVGAGTGISVAADTVDIASTYSPGTATEMGATQNLDDLNAAQAGFYYQTANADTTGNNYPSGEAGSLIVQKSAGNATQMYQSYTTSPKLHFRSRYTGSWGTWQRVFADNYHPNADTLTTARTLTIGGTGKTFNGSANVSWSLAEIGVDAAGTINYTHPTHPGDDFSVDTGPLTGATVVSDIDINVTTDTLGHVTDANGAVSTRTLTLADLGYTGATNANNYSHPTHPGDDFSVDTGALTGATVVSDIDINVTTDTLGHVTDANGTVSTRTLTAADIGAQASGDYAVINSTSTNSNDYLHIARTSTGAVAYFNNTSTGDIARFINNATASNTGTGGGATGQFTVLNGGGFNAGGTCQMRNAIDLDFLNSTNTDDGTRIYRAGGNALRIAYAGNSCIFDAVANHTWQIRDSADAVKFQLDPSTGITTVYGDVLPASPAVYDLGSSSAEFQLGYINTLYVSDYIYHNDDTNTYLQFDAADSFRVVTGGVERMQWNSNGVEVPDFIRHAGDTNTYMQFHGADLWRVVTAGVERLEVGAGTIQVNNSTLDMNGTIEMGDNIIDQPEIRDYGLTHTTYTPTVAQAFDCTVGNTFTLDLESLSNPSISPTFTNPSPSGTYCEIKIIVIQDSVNDRTITWPASVKWPGGTAPVLTTTNDGVDIYHFCTVDGGTTWYGTAAQDFS